MKMVSLRLDEKAEKELDYIKSVLHESQSQALKEAIHAYYEILMKTKSQKNPAEIFKSSGFIGCFNADRDLSSDYKRKLNDNLEKKHGTK
jgi:hypothetical protein